MSGGHLGCHKKMNLPSETRNENLNLTFKLANLTDLNLFSVSLCLAAILDVIKNEFPI